MGHSVCVGTYARVLAFALLAISALYARSPQDGDPAPILIQVYSPGPVGALGLAVDTADEILDSAGVHPRWAQCASWSKRTGDCSPDAEPLVIELHLERWTAETYRPGVLGETQPFSDSPVPSRIFLNRILTSNRNLSTGARVLGHVLAHEIGHALLRTDWHASSGLMSPTWSPAELFEMNHGFLAFDDIEVRMMQRSIAGRLHPPAPSGHPGPGTGSIWTRFHP